MTILKERSKTYEKDFILFCFQHVYVSNAILPGKEYGRVYGSFVMHQKIICDYLKPLPGSYESRA